MPKTDESDAAAVVASIIAAFRVAPLCYGRLHVHVQRDAPAKQAVVPCV